MIWSQPRLFQWILNLTFSCFFCLIGAAALVAPWAPPLQRMLIDLMVNQALLMTLIGITLLAVGVMLFLLSRGSSRQYYQVKVGSRAIQVDETVIRQYLDEYWAKLLPEQEVMTDLKVDDKQIHVIADLPPFPFERQRSLIERIERELSQLLSDVLGANELSLSLSFRPDPVR